MTRTTDDIYQTQTKSMKWMVGLFCAGIASVTGATAYLEQRAEALYASKIEVAEMRKEMVSMARANERKEAKLDLMEQKQTATLVQLAEINARLETLLDKRRRRK